MLAAANGWVAHEYNDRQYSDRGWCSFEGSVSVELIARLAAYPKMEALLNSLPPKLLSLSAERAAEPVAWEAHAGGRHVEHAVRCIEDATFTGKGDKPKVVVLYKEYVSRTVSALARTLALASTEDATSGAGADAPSSSSEMRMLPVPPAIYLRLGAAQPVQVTPGLHDRRDGSDGGVLVAVVDPSGRGAKSSLGGGHIALSLEHCSQAVLPWLPTPEVGWEEALMRDVDALRAVGAQMRQLRAADEEAPTAAQDEVAAAQDEVAAAKAAKAVKAVLSQLEATAGATTALTRLAKRLQDAIEIDALTSLLALERIVGMRALEVAAAESFAASGARGRLRYAPQQLLSVRVASGEWVDVEVTEEEDREAAVEEMAEGSGKAAAIVSAGVLHSLRLGPLHEGWIQLTHGATANARRYALVWPDRVDVHARSDGGGGEPLLVVPLCVTTSASLAAGGTRLTILNGAVEVRLMATAEAAPATTQMHAWLEALQRAIGGAASERLEAWLHPWNHAPRELPKATFEAMRAWHCERLRKQHSAIRDALSGRSLDVLRQCVAIEMESSGDRDRDGELAQVKDAAGLAGVLCAIHEERRNGMRSLGSETGPGVVLLTAGPAAGKTSLLSQLVLHLLAQAESANADSTTDSATEPLLPIVVRVQLLQLRLREGGAAFAGAWNWVDAYLRSEHGAQSALYRFLRQAMLSRRAVLLLDGLDEGGEEREAIERHVIEVLAVQGHVMLCTSRPDGIREERYARFQRLRLAPLTDAQQREAFEQRLGAKRTHEVLPYLGRLPVDAESGRRITSNPLMLSMVASIIELREGLELPETVVELYHEATKAMLARAGGGKGGTGGGMGAIGLRQLLQAAFFEAHVRQARVITSDHLEAASRRVGGARALLLLKERVAADRMPLLSLLQASPLQLQASHLSFQEFFTCQAICEGATPPLPPWALPAWWANTLRLGTEMSAAFGEGLARAAGEELSRRSVRLSLTGDADTSSTAIGLALRASTRVEVVQVAPSRHSVNVGALRSGQAVHLDWSRSRATDGDLKMLAAFAHGFVALESLSLTRTQVGRDGVAAVIGIPSLRSLDISKCKALSSDEDLRALGTALKSSSTSRLAALKCEAFELRVGAASMSKSSDVGQQLAAGAAAQQLAKALLEGLKAAGFSCAEAKRASYSFSCAQAKAAGYSCNEAKEAGYSCHEAKAAGFDLRALEATGFDLADIAKAYSSSELGIDRLMQKVGSSLDQLKEATTLNWTKNLADMDCKVIAYIVSMGAMAQLQVSWRRSALIPCLEL